MTITELFSSPQTYRIVHLIADADGLRYESEGAVHHPGNDVQMVTLPTREEDRRAIRTALVSADHGCREAATSSPR